MKNKRFFVNFSGILLAFAIAFGGIFALWSRLERERAELLSGGGQVEIPVRNQSMASQTMGVVDVEVKVADLTGEELLQAISCLESTSEKYAREPMPGQLSMTEAVQSAMGWLEGFFLSHLGREEAIPKEYQLSCYLWAESDKEKGGEWADLLSGYWEVSLSGEEMESVLFLNAVTGQVLKAWISLPFPGGEWPDKDSLSLLLEDYADSLGIETHYVISRAEDTERGDSVYGSEDNKIGDSATEDNERESEGLAGMGGGSPEKGSQSTASKEDWGFGQRLENDEIAVCLEAGNALSTQVPFTNSREALCFALYLETKAFEE